jgi:signal peptidase I
MVEPVRAKTKAEAQASKKRTQEGGIGEIIKVVVQALLIALVVRTFAFQPFNIPSGSLIPTLLIGDYLFVSKYAYGYSKYSFPFSPDLFNGRIFGVPPKRGDIVVFKLPRDDATDYIKRVIGLPHDKIQVKDARLFINGYEVPRQSIGTYTTLNAFGKDVQVPYYNETLPGPDTAHPDVGAVTHQIIQRDGDTGYYSNLPQTFEVPDNEYFMMGDNRDNSLDSRVPPEQGGVGYVPFENLEGRAEVIFFSIKTTVGSNGEETEPAWQFWRWPWTVRWDRIFQRVH